MKKQKLGNSTSPTKSTLPQFWVNRLRESTFIVVITGILFVLISLISLQLNGTDWSLSSNASAGVNAGGAVGSYIANVLYFCFGYFAYAFPACFACFAWLLLKETSKSPNRNKTTRLLRAIAFLCLFGGGCGLLQLAFDGYIPNIHYAIGGIVGQASAYVLSLALNTQGATLVLLAMFLIGTTWLTGFSWVNGIEKIGYYTVSLLRLSLKTCAFFVKIIKKSVKRVKVQVQSEPRNTSKRASISKDKPDKPPVKIPASVQGSKAIKEVKDKTGGAPRAVVTGRLPSLQLLNKGRVGKPKAGYTPQELETLSRDVEQYLLDFGIQADVVAVHPGPVITRFELQLAAGVKVSKLTALAKDLARSLSVLSVRVVEVIPGKTVVGIELPNQNREMVCLSEVLSAEVYQQAHSPLTLALGVDIAGHPMVVDLAKMPHLLVAGTTGSGKSVGINAMILSLLFKATPEQVRLIMVDPKMLELSVYDGIPHLLTPVVTDMKEAASALRWCVGEMERRYRLMASLGVRNLVGFNNKVMEAEVRNTPLTDPLWKPGDSIDTHPPLLQQLPYVVVVIDELADMMMVVGKKVEQLIARIAQKARAAGIHLILATQRPSVDVLTGLIKSNIPTRISFQVSSKIDSRTILDQQGAEQLLGHGDMLFLAPGTGAPLRVHGAFVEDAEVHRIADDWRARGEPQYLDEITINLNENSEGDFEEGAGQTTEEADVLYDQVVEFVIQTRKASISAVQRRFKIGYNRAARLVEEMERTGVVGPVDGGFRDVLVQAIPED